MPAAELKTRWAHGAITYGATLRLGHTFTAEVIARSGFDYIKFDMEHGFNWPHMVLPMIQAINGTGATPLAKVGKLDPELIGWLLDLGMEGITGPGISTPEEAAYAVSCTRHVPAGIRSGSSFYTKYLPGGRDRELIVIATIESLEGVKNARAIAGTAGISGVLVGPANLAHELGLPPQDGHTTPQAGPLLDAIKTIHQACRQAQVPYGHPASHDNLRPEVFIEMGCQLISFGSDTTFFEQGMKAAFKNRP